MIILLVGCSASKNNSDLSKSELFTKLSKGFIIQKLPNWEFHGFHGVLNYTPKELMNVGYEYIYNGIIATTKEVGEETLSSFVAKEIDRQNSLYKVTNFKKIIEQTRYGKSIVLVYDAEINRIDYKVIRQFYLHQGIIYEVAYSAKSKFFDFFVNDAIHMMKTFTITQ
ncbi:hypothetical protein [Kordia algicida]|uniref:hypothetical protein n=1 Tax=Kordia algicida TaxID=221066 RepID=UPI0003083B02|nr:hypothetical protein [Kordia algicida]